MFNREKMKESYLFLAEGFEEVEALMTIDIMRRAGIEVTTVAIDNYEVVTGAHGVQVVADALIDEIGLSDPENLNGVEWLILPGGMPGASNLAECSQLVDALLAHNANEGKIAAICAAPAVVLNRHGLLQGRRATCYPGFECPGTTLTAERVTVDGNIVTANGPSSASNFALEIVRQTKGDEAAIQVAAGMLF